MTWKICLPPFLMTLVMGVILYAIDLQVWGMDGNNLWMPIVSEFLRETYENSPVIFAGQNLLAIYGKLPFWEVLKWINVSPETLLNITFLVCFFLLSVFSISITQGIRKESPVNPWIISLYCLLSPIIINRVYAGHFNLILGMLPLIVAISFFYVQSWWMIILSVFALTCSFSIVSYQILSYHLFYIPIWFVWLKMEKPDFKRYLKVIVPCVLFSILFSYPSLKAIIGHATNPENLRAAAGEVVYSYTVSSWIDLAGLFFSSLNAFSSPRDLGFFHEMNYSVGLFLMMVFFLREEIRLIGVTIVITLFVMFAFSAAVPGISLLSKLPIIELFRVPQRSLMLPAFLLPLLVLAQFPGNYKSLGILIVLTIVVQFVPYAEICLLVIGAGIFLSRRQELFKLLAAPIVLASLFCDLGWKWELIKEGSDRQSEMIHFLEEIDVKLQLRGSSKVVHFESAYAGDLVAAANVLGIITAEGYGHPPASLVQKISEIANVGFHPMTNKIEVNQDFPEYKDVLIGIGVTDIVYVSPNGYFRKSPEEL